MEKRKIASISSKSLEDFSEYADAEESISAPTELLAEFLHSVMVKDYEKALRYCNQILSYEPDYAAVKEFLPIIEEKLAMLRNEESEDCSSSSSASLSSSTSGSSDNLNIIKNKTSWEAESFNSSNLDSDDEANKISRIRKNGVSYSDIANGNSETHRSPQTTEDSIGRKDSKSISTSETRTILNAKLPAHKTRTRVLRRDSGGFNHNNEFSNLKNENSSTLLHPTNTRVLTKDDTSEPAKDNNSRTFAWFSSLHENIFGSKKRDDSASKKSVQNKSQK